MDIKKTIIEKKLKQYEIAEIIGVSEFTLSRWLRKPEKLPNDKKQKIEMAIKNLIEREV